MVDAILCNNVKKPSQQPQEYSASFQVPRPGDLRSNPWTLQHGSPSLQQNTTTLQHLASTPASRILQDSKFKRLMAAFVLRTAAIACKKKAVIQPKCKRPSFTCDYLAETTSIHSLFREVRPGQCLSVSVSVCQVKATSGQLISNGFTGLSPCIAAVTIGRQIDVNNRVV